MELNQKYYVIYISIKVTKNNMKIKYFIFAFIISILFISCNPPEKVIELHRNEALSFVGKQQFYLYEAFGNPEELHAIASNAKFVKFNMYYDDFNYVFEFFIINDTVKSLTKYFAYK
jgi:hypothetical protein